MAKIDILGERWLVMGTPKSGKSHFAATFPDPICLNADGAMNKYAYERSRRHDINNMEDFKGQLAWARQHPEAWRTLIMDPLDKVASWVDADVCRILRGETVATSGKDGAGWYMQLKLFHQMIDSFYSAAESNPRLAASIIIAHSKSDNEARSLVIRKALHTKVQGDSNNIVCCFKKRERDDDGSKIVTFHADLSGSNNVEAGCRNAVLQAAGIIDNPSWNGICDLFLDKAYTWLEKGGITRERFITVMEKRGVTSREDLYDILRTAKDQPEKLAELQKLVKE